MKLLLPFKGGRLDYDQLTAKKVLVRKGKLFVGAGEESAQTGELESVAAITYEMPLNGRYDIPAGIHDESSTVKQTSLSTMDGGTVYPTSDTQTVKTKNKYMTEDVYISPLTGLEPGNIKKDVTILGVKGTYEGYS